MKSWFYLIFFPALWTLGHARAQEVRFRKDGAFAFTSSGAWKSATLGGKSLPLISPESVVSICDVEQGGGWIPLSGSVHGETAQVRMDLISESLALKATLTVSGDDSAAGFHLHIMDSSGRDRGLLVRVSLPVDAVGWQWWDDMNRHRSIEAGHLYEDVMPLRAFAALPEWEDRPDLRMGLNTPNFCTVLSGPVGLCLAVPLDQPRIFRTAYDAKTKRLSITYDVALCRETEPPSQALFQFELYDCDPDWGMRSALDRYYQRHPDFFTKHFDNEGMWIAFSRLNEIDNVTEFGPTIQEGGASFTYDDQIGVDSFSYYTHAGIYANVPDHRRGIDPTPSLERRIAAVEANLKRSTGRDQVYAECGLYDPTGQLSAEPGSVYGDVLAQFSMEPELFYGRYLLDQIDGFFESYRKRGGELDGLYYDGLTTGINYRREHFRHAGYPPSWDPIARKPYLYNYFSSVEWARLVAEKLHSMGKATMMNGAMKTNPFCAPYLDIMGAETGLNLSQADFSFVKSICHHKTFATLLKGNYAQMGSNEIELFMKRCLTYGVFPGFFDWPPSGLGPGGRYWDHPEYFERDRAIFRKYQPLVKQIAAAGWEPLTHARVADSALHVERFGREFFTVLNDSIDPRQSTLTIAADQLNLPLENLVVFDELASAPVPWERKGDILLVSLDLPPQSLALLQVTKKENFVARHLESAEKILRVGEIQRKADHGRPSRPIYWAVTESLCHRDDQALLLRNEKDSQKATASQWAMLFQEEVKPVTIRARVKTKDVLGDRGGTFAIEAVVCHVDKQFTSRDSQVLPLEPGSGDWRDIEWQFTPDRPVRSIQIVLKLENRVGSVWFDKISVRSADSPEKECIVDGDFDAWYDLMKPDQLALLAPKLDDVRNAVIDTRTEPSVSNLVAALKTVRSASSVLSEFHLGSSTRREQRDLDATQAHLNACIPSLLRIDGLTLNVPTKAAVGETIPIQSKVLAADGVVQRTELTLSSSDGKIDGSLLILPPGVLPGSKIILKVEATVTLETGERLPLSATRQISITTPFEANARLDGVELADGGQVISLLLENHLFRSQRFQIAVTAPEGWTTRDLRATTDISSQGSERVQFVIAPSDAVKSGRYEALISVKGEGQSDPAVLSLKLSHVPAATNRIKNPSFESGDSQELSHWSAGLTGYAADSSASHSGRQSLRIQTTDARVRASAFQGIALNQSNTQPLIIRAYCKTENVIGSSLGCCLYVDLYYADGSKLYGQKVYFDPGTHDWQFREMKIETSKPVRSLNMHVMMDGVTGVAWFDDLFLAETP